MPARKLVAPDPPPQLLEKLRDGVRRYRDLEAELSDLEGLVRAAAKEKIRLEMEELPDIFSQAQMRSFTLEAEGNQPAFVAKCAPYYKANIAADWAPERREAAFDWLSRRDPKGDADGVGADGGNNPDIIKTQITVVLDRGNRAHAEMVEAALRDLEVPYEVSLSVPWNTLSAYMKELVEDHHVMPPLDLLGATVGRRVTIKPERS